MSKDIDKKIHNACWNKFELVYKKDGGYKPEYDSVVFQQVAEELELTKEEVEENFYEHEKEFEADLVYAEHKEEIDRLEAEEFYPEAYLDNLNQIAEENQRRNKEILELKCNLLTPLLTNKTKLSAHIKALKEELNGSASYEDKAIYEDIISILQRIQVA